MIRRRIFTRERWYNSPRFVTFVANAALLALFALIGATMGAGAWNA